MVTACPGEYGPKVVMERRSLNRFRRRAKPSAASAATRDRAAVPVARPPRGAGSRDPEPGHVEPGTGRPNLVPNLSIAVASEFVIMGSFGWLSARADINNNHAARQARRGFYGRLRISAPAVLRVVASADTLCR
jgi:hypothetical protein